MRSAEIKFSHLTQQESCCLLSRRAQNTILSQGYSHAVATAPYRAQESLQMPKLKALNSVPSPSFLQNALSSSLLCQVAQYMITAAPIHRAEKRLS